MYTYQYGGKRGPKYNLVESTDMIVVRTRNRNVLKDADLSEESQTLVSPLESVVYFPAAGVEVLRLEQEKRTLEDRDKLRTQLKKEKNVRFAGRVLCDETSSQPVVYTENFFVKFNGTCSPEKAKEILASKNLKIKDELKYAGHAYFVEAPEGTGTKVFDIAANLMEDPNVEYCHPELVHPIRERKFFSNQWHLAETDIDGKHINAHAHVQEAWDVSRGKGVIIAVVDDGIDIDHPEFKSAGKVVSPRDVTMKVDDPRPKNSFDKHGTACAGVACADGNYGASGVAPEAKLMPIRYASGIGSQAEANAFVWAAEHGADVISCSWGPTDGAWWNPNDPLHNMKFPLPDSTRFAIDYAIQKGRGGKGCVITWAAGNGNECVDNDGYAGYSNVIAIAACSDAGERSKYSDFGKAVWCAFPSNQVGEGTQTSGIWTTDRKGAQGYNPGDEEKGDSKGDYTNSFGGTSSACPGVAGIAALILSCNPDLKWDEVKEILKNSCDRIDEANGKYDSNGHSYWYGYGRINAAKAVARCKSFSRSSEEKSSEKGFMSWFSSFFGKSTK